MTTQPSRLCKVTGRPGGPDGAGRGHRAEARGRGGIPHAAVPGVAAAGAGRAAAGAAVGGALRHRRLPPGRPFLAKFPPSPRVFCELHAQLIGWD